MEATGGCSRSVVAVCQSGTTLSVSAEGRLVFSTYCAEYWALLISEADGDSGGLSRIGFQHLRTRRYLALAPADRRPVLVDCAADADWFRAYFDNCGNVVLQSHDGLYLGSDRHSGLHATCERMSHRKAAKLLQLEEHTVAGPLPAPLPVPLRLRGGSGYLSAGGDRLAAGAQAACCQENFLLALGPLGPGAVGGGGNCTLPASLWSSDGTRVATRREDGALQLAGRHEARGHEALQVCSANQRLQLGFTPPAAAPGARGAPAAGVACGPGGAVGAHAGSQPERWSFELVPDRRVALVTSHGALLCSHLAGGGAADGFSRSPVAAVWSSGPAEGGEGAAAAAAVWRLQHHGDDVYSLAQRGQQGEEGVLCVDEAGAVCLSSHPSLAFPSQACLFRLRLHGARVHAPAWLEAQAGSGGGGGGGLAAAGFTLQTYRKVRGSHLYLSAKPNGHISAESLRRPGRWELFTPADWQALASAAVLGSAAPRCGGAEGCGGCGLPLLAGVGACRGAAVTGRLLELEQEVTGGRLSASGCRLRRLGGSFTSLAAAGGSCAALDVAASAAEMEDGERSLPRLALCGEDEAPPHGWGQLSPAPLALLAATAVADALAQQGRAAEDVVEVLSAAGIPGEVAELVRGQAAAAAPPPPSVLPAADMLALAGEGGEEEEGGGLDPWDANLLSKAYCCSACKGSSGLLLPLDAASSPMHHRYLAHARRQHYAHRAAAAAGAAGGAPRGGSLASLLLSATFAFAVGRLMRTVTDRKPHVRIAF